MKQEEQDFNILCQAVLLIIEESKKPSYLPEWLYNFWHADVSNVSGLKEAIQDIMIELKTKPEHLNALEEQLILRLDLERYVVTVHLQDEALRNRIQDAMLTALFFSKGDVEKYEQYVLAEQDPEKFFRHLERNEELLSYEDYLLHQQSIYGRFAKNFTQAEIIMAAKGKMINGKLFSDFGLEKFLKHGFKYVKKELKALQINKIEKGYLTKKRIDGDMEKISFLMHPANELHQDTTAFIKNARYLLEDIINAAGLKEAGVPMHKEHEAIIFGCYWVDEMFKVATAHSEVLE